MAQQQPQSPLFDGSVLIARAQGRVSAQVDCTLDEALLLMRGRAASSDRRLAEIVAAVLVGGLRFG
jgi:hypothetical protein